MKTVSAVRALVRAFGPRPKYLFMLLFRLALQASMVVFMALDRVLLPHHARRQLDRPVFLIGHLRSGTTFLHRFLLEQTPELRGLLMWEMLCPSVIARTLMRPLRPLFGRISLDRVWDPKIHRTGVLAAETDDIALAFRYSGGILSWIYNDAWANQAPEQARAAVAAASQDDVYVHHLRRIYRGVVADGGRLLSKSFYGLFCVDAIRRLFPQARLLLLIRDPAEAVPSMMSMQRSVQGALHGFDSDPERAATYYRNLYQCSLAYYERFHAVASAGGDDVIVVTHRQLLTEFDATIRRVFDWAGLALTPALEAELDRRNAAQPKHRSAHGYGLDEFGLTEAQIADDFAFVYAHYAV